MAETGRDSGRRHGGDKVMIVFNPVNTGAFQGTCKNGIPCFWRTERVNHSLLAYGSGQQGQRTTQAVSCKKQGKIDP